jgi:hypothetical protein
LGISGIEVYSQNTQVSTYKTMSSPNQMFVFKSGQLVSTENGMALTVLQSEGNGAHVRLGNFSPIMHQGFKIVYLDDKKA